MGSRVGPLLLAPQGPERSNNFEDLVPGVGAALCACLSLALFCLMAHREGCGVAVPPASAAGPFGSLPLSPSSLAYTYTSTRSPHPMPSSAQSFPSLDPHQTLSLALDGCMELGLALACLEAQHMWLWVHGAPALVRPCTPDRAWLSNVSRGGCGMRTAEPCPCA